MTYLPNSIERCAPIVGFDPYAYIMDKPSNLTFTTAPTGSDCFSSSVKDKKSTDSKGAQGADNKNKNTSKKPIDVAGLLRAAAGITAVTCAIIGLKRGVSHFKGKGAPKVSSAATNKTKNFGGKILKKAGDIGGKVKTFILDKWNALKTALHNCFKK